MYQPTMTIKADKRDEWNRGLANNTDSYGRRCFTYADEWATLMERRMVNGKTVKDIADKASHDADTDGITGFMYGAAVSILVGCWIHGEELRRWHNKETQIGTEGDAANENGGVLNPAVLTIG